MNRLKAEIRPLVEASVIDDRRLSRSEKELIVRTVAQNGIEREVVETLIVELLPEFDAVDESQMPVLKLESAIMRFVGLEKGSKAQRFLEIQNVGGGELSGRVTTATPWLKVIPTVIDSKAIKQMLTVSVDTDQLSHGLSEKGSIEIASNAGNTTLQVYVEVKPLASAIAPSRPEVRSSRPRPERIKAPPPPTPLPPRQSASVSAVTEYVPPVAQSSSRRGGGRGQLVVISLVTVAAIAIAVYLALESSSTTRLAASLRSAVDNGRLVTLSNDDAYSYFFQLRSQDATNKALIEIAPKVLPELRRMGDETFAKKSSVTTEKLTEQDWSRTHRAYEWARVLEPRDRSLEGRWRFAEGEVAKAQGRKIDAERSFAAAAGIDQNWALAQNSLGLLRSESKRYSEAVPYFQRAIQLQPNWEIPYNNLGTAYFFQKEYDTALSWYRKALEKNPNWPRPHGWIGSIYELKKMRSEAISEYQTAIDLDPHSNMIDANDIKKKIERLQR